MKKRLKKTKEEKHIGGRVADLFGRPFSEKKTRERERWERGRKQGRRENLRKEERCLLAKEKPQGKNKKAENNPHIKNERSEKLGKKRAIFKINSLAQTKGV